MRPAIAEPIGHFARLEPGKTFKVDPDNDNQAPLYSNPRAAFRRNLRVEHRGDRLVLSDRISELGTYVYPVDLDGTGSDGQRIVEARRRAVAQMLDLYGGPLEPLPADVAMARLRQVNSTLRDSTFRRRDTEGNPGALLEIPDRLTPIIIGDLHGRLDNLLSAMTENSARWNSWARST